MAKKVDKNNIKETVEPILTPKEKELMPDALPEASDLSIGNDFILEAVKNFCDENRELIRNQLEEIFEEDPEPIAKY